MEHKDAFFTPSHPARFLPVFRDCGFAGRRAHLDEGKGVKNNAKDPAVFAAPHATCVDSRGDFYVMEWVDFCRRSKFKHPPQPA